MDYPSVATVIRNDESPANDARAAHLPLDRFLDHLTEAGCFTLLRWARQEAPELLHALMKAFVAGRPARDKREIEPAAGSARLRDIEREHIRRVLAASKTVREAAQTLGIDGATLWRKRKRYQLE
jgi:transcriptional regulator of acetoin/glycerol metabolism